MKILKPSTFLACLILAASLAGAAPLTSAFTYQGRLVENSIPANGPYDLSFKLFDALAGGGQAGATVTNLNVAVSNGVFTVPLDFGPTVFNGTAYWLEVAVRPAGGGAFTLLNPRQPLTATPYAWYAASAAQAASVTANAINSTALVDASVTSNKIAGGQVVKSLNGLRDHVVLLAGNNLTLATNGNALTLATTGWGLGGNAGTVPGQDYLGTADYQPLDLRVNNQRFLRATPTAESPNLTGGFLGNSIGPDAVGAVIAGGGQNAEINLSESSFSFIGGGRDNLLGANSSDSLIVGGYFNTVFSNTYAAVVGGGYANFVDSYSHFATIAGGANNMVFTNASGAVIAGGQYNSIETDAEGAGIASGTYNTNQAAFAAISGGRSNLIYYTASFGVIAGGELNYLGDTQNAVVGGGYYNYVDDGAHLGTIAGGNDNWIKPDAVFGTIPGGSQAAAESYGQQAYASGMFSTWGDAQASLFVLRGSTTNAVPREIFLDGAAARITLANNNSSWTFQVTVVGRNAAGGTACFKVEGGIKNVGGTVSLIGTPTVTTIASDLTLGGTPVVAAADNTNKALIIRCTGATGVIRWVARVQTVELRF